MTSGTRPAPDISEIVRPARYNSALIAVFRVGVALMWIQNVAWKRPPDFGEGDPPGGLYRWTSFAVEYEVLAPYAWVVDNVVLPNFRLFGWGVLIVEASLGAFLLVGLLTRFWALVGAAQSTVILLSAANAPHEWHWSYLLMILAHIALFATAAGRHWGVDGVLEGRGNPHRAIFTLGLASVASVIFVVSLGDFRFIVIDGAAIIVALALGFLACVAGWLKIPDLAIVVGAAFLVGSVLKVVLVAVDEDWLGGNLTTTSLWLGLGLGILTIGFSARRSAPAEQRY